MIARRKIALQVIDRRKPNDLEPAYIIDSVRELINRLIIVRGDYYLSNKAQDNAMLSPEWHPRATFALRRISLKPLRHTLSIPTSEYRM